MTDSTGVQRTYLYVPPEEKSEVEVLGGHWDDDSKRWYIEADAASGRFSRRLADDEPDDEFRIISTDAYVAAAHAVCDGCAAPMEVICIHCASGTVSTTLAELGGPSGRSRRDSSTLGLFNGPRRRARIRAWC